MSEAQIDPVILKLEKIERLSRSNLNHARGFAEGLSLVARRTAATEARVDEVLLKMRQLSLQSFFLGGIVMAGLVALMIVASKAYG